MPTLEREAEMRTIVLGEHETTGLLPVGFEFEWQGARYDSFGLSTDGFVVFARGGREGRVRTWVPLLEQGRLGGGLMTYRVRGDAPRRRLAVLLALTGPSRGTLEIAVHERTGIVEICRTGQSLGEPTIRQLDITQSSPSRPNSARKIG